MARVEFNGDIDFRNYKLPEYEIKQGDFVFCDAGNSGAFSFWGIYSASLRSVISLNGAGECYIPKLEKIYLYDTYNGWTITKRISTNRAKVVIEETE